MWTYLRSNFSEFNLYVFGLFSLHLTLFWSFNACLLYADFHNPKKWLQFKIQDGTNRPLDSKKVRHILRVVVFNQLLVLLLLYLSYFIIDLSRFFAPSLPGPIESMFHFAGFLLIEEIMFYYSHRLLHTKYLYGAIHKKHHEWTSPIGIVCFYSHPIEHIFGNLLPMFVGPIVFRTHFMLAAIWSSVAIITIIVSHSGYHLPFLTSPEAHDYHHLKFNEMYGVLGILDSLHGTDKNFRKSYKNSLHQVFLTTEYPQLKNDLTHVN